MTAEGEPRKNALWRALSGNFVGEVVLKLPALAWDFWAARSLSRFAFGVWTGFRILTSLNPYLQGVALFGVDLRYSFLVGAKKPEEARLCASAAASGTILMGIATSALLAAGCFSTTLREQIVPGSTPLELAVFAAMINLQSFYAAYGTHLRNRLLFGAMNYGMFIGQAASLAAALYAAPRFGVVGCIAAYSVSFALSAILWARHLDMAPLFAKGTWPEFKELAKIGAPLVVSGATLDMLRLAVRFFVSRSLGVEALGTYGGAYIFVGMVVLAGTSVSRVVIQFFGRAEGAQVDRAEQAQRYFYLPALAVAAVSALGSSAAWIGAELVLPWVAPKQVGALEVLRPALYGALPFASLFLYMTMLRGQGRIWELIVANLLTLALNVAALFVVSAFGGGLAWYTGVEAFAFGALLFGLVGLRGATLGARRWRFLGLLAIVFGVTALALEVGTRVSASLGAPLRAVVESACALAGVLLWAPLLWRARTTLGAPERAPEL